MKNELEGRKNNQAYFTLTLFFENAKLSLSPHREMMVQKFNEQFKGMIDTIIEAPRLISIFSKKNYEQILLVDSSNQNDKNNLDPERVNLKTNDSLDDKIKSSFKHIIDESKYYGKYTKIV